MVNGINIDNTATPRSLALDGVKVAQGGSANAAGLYSVGSDLYLDGQKIAEGEDNNGLLVKGSDLFFGGVEVGGDTPTPPTPPTPVESDLWIPPTQSYNSNRSIKDTDIISGYDALMSSSAYPGTIKKYEYHESDLVETTIKDSRYGNEHTHRSCSHSFTEAAAGSYNTDGDVLDIEKPLYHYEFTPANYTKTFYVQAGIHGNEKDAPQTILRFFDIICNHCNEAAYSRLASLRDNVRFIVVPVVSPVGLNSGQTGSMNVPFVDWDGETTDERGNTLYMNMNRNFDFNQTYAITSGKGGNYPNQRSEVRHVVAVIDKIGKENFDFFLDNHDGGGVHKHFWFNYNMDGTNAPVLRQLLADLIAYEEELIANGGTDYRRLLSYVIKAGETSLEYTSSDYTHTKKQLTIPISTQAIADAVNADGITFTGSSYLLHEVIKASGGVNTTIRANYETFILPDENESVTVRTYKVNNVDTILSVEVGDTITAIVSPQADSGGWIHPNVADQGGYSTGTASGWAGITEAILSSGPEYIGGLFGYTFNDEQRTRSLRIRANAILYAYERINNKGLDINESADADYFHWDYAPSITRQLLRKDDTASDKDNNVLTIEQVYARWDKLAAANSSYITKSASLGQNAGGNDIYCYTLGSGAKKVLFLGGSMRYAVNAKDTEMGMYMLAEWLCSPYLLNQSAFLQRIKNNYTIVVLPCIDITAGANRNTWPINQRSLNNSFEGNGSKAKWIVSNGKCTPKYNDIADVNIFLAWISNHDDALVLLSGGELKTTNSTVGKPDYSTDYMTQFIVPKNQATSTWLTDYCTHLEDDRGEDAPDVENTAGLTCGDYAYDNLHIKTYFVNLNVSQMWDARKQYAQANDSADAYMYRNYETGRRVANIVNIILMAGGDIAVGGGLINNE